MRVPLTWLLDFAPFPARPGDRASVTALGQAMDDLGMVVEGIELAGEGLSDVVVGRVLEVGAIPGADRIRRVVLDQGTGEPVEVVCGAWNFEEGDLVPLAPVGAVLPGGFRISRRKMKGVTSHGMLCSGQELRLSDEAEGILVLGREGLEPGTPLVEALGLDLDVVYDLAIETNRPDALCVAGVARDLAARLGLPFRLPEPPGVVGAAAGPPLASLEVVASDLCPRFLARVLDVAGVAPTPAWMTRRLTLAGMRPIGPVVDATNYVMLELGQPSHPYDLGRLAGPGLLVRRAEPGERLVTLDGVERVLGRHPRTRQPVDDCLICDARGGPVGIGGIMGGRSTEIGPSTERVMLEAAWFSPMAVARTSRRLGLRTEASVRFERGCDPSSIERALDRICQLLAGGGSSAEEGAGGDPGRTGMGGVVVPGLLEAGGVPPRPRVRLRTARVNSILGTALGDEQVARYLAPLGFACTSVAPGLAEVEIPGWRPDAEREIDLIEEVARHHGYSSIPRTRPRSPTVGALTGYQRDRRKVRATLMGLGASEAWTSSLLGPLDHERAGMAGPVLEVENPMAREESVLRRSLLPGLLAAVGANAAHQDPEVALFEIGHVFAPRAGVAGAPGPAGAKVRSEELVDEREVVALALARAGDDARQAVAAWRALAGALRLADPELAGACPPGLHRTRSARALAGGVELGVVGEVDPSVLEGAGLGGRRVGWLEIDLGALLASPRLPEEARPVSRFPSAEFDLAFVVDDAVPASAVEASLRQAAGDLLEAVSLFDVYRGEGIGAGRRSLAYRLRLAALDRTLTPEDLARARAACVEAVGAAHGGQLRT